MDALGIEIGRDSWRLLHVEGSLRGPKVLRQMEIGGTPAERASAIAKYVSADRLSGARLGIVIPRKASVSRIIDIPAPGKDAIDGIIKFEIEKYLPFAPTDAYYGYQIMERNGNTYSVYIGACTKKSIDEIMDVLSSAGMEIHFVCFWQEALLNSLARLGMIQRNLKNIFIGADSQEITIDAFSGFLPVYSKQIDLNCAAAAQVLQRELYLLVAALEWETGDFSIIFFVDPGKEALSSLPEELKKNCRILKQDSLDNSGLAAFGGALAAIGSGKGRINLLSSAAHQKGGYLGTLLLSAFMVFLLGLTGISYIVRDLLILKQLDGSISELKDRKEGLEAGAGKTNAMAGKIKTLESISTGSSTRVLELMRELTERMPDDSWLTSLEYSDDTVIIEGISSNASSLLIRLEDSSLMEDFEFVAPVVTISKGKEKFRIKSRVSGKKGEIA